MQTAMQLCMFGSEDDLNMRSIVKRRGQELGFYKDLLAITQTGMYSLSAVVGIRTGQVWTAVLSNDLVRKNSLRFLMNNRDFFDIRPGMLRTLNVFNKWLGMTAALGLLATGTEMFRVYKKLTKSKGQEQVLYSAQMGSLLATSFVLGIQTVGFTGVLPLSLTLGMFSTGVLAIAAVIYIGTSLLLEAEKKDSYQKWLSELPWGTSPNRKHWSYQNKYNFTSSR